MIKSRARLRALFFAVTVAAALLIGPHSAGSTLYPPLAAVPLNPCGGGIGTHC